MRLEIILRKKLCAQGNTWQLYINKTFVKMLGITKEEYTVHIEADEEGLTVKKVPNAELDKYKDLLCKKLIKRGSAYGLNFDVSLLELLEVNPETDEIDFKVIGQTMYIKKAK